MPEILPTEGTPFFLHEAVVTLYLADAAGQQLTSAKPVWPGALATSLKLEDWFDEVHLSSTGDLRRRRQQLDENHIIEFGRVWLVRKSTGKTFTLVRNARYVMEIVWWDLKHWYRRVYFGVTIPRLTRTSERTNHSQETQRFDAESMVETGGPGDPSVTVPVDPQGGEQVSLFTKELPLLTGEYLAGSYRWSAAATGVRATVHGKAPQNTSCKVTLEIAGVLTGFVLTLVTDPPDTPVTDEVDLSALEIPANALVRWLVTQAPIPTDSATEVSVEMTVDVEA